MANWHNLGIFQGFKRSYVPPEALRELVVDVRRTTGADQVSVTLVRANAIGNSDAEYTFILRTIGEHPNSRKLKNYSPSNTLRLRADQIGSGIDLYVYARSVGSVSRYDVKKKIRIVP